MTKVGETAIYDPPREFSGNKVHACTKHTRTLKTKDFYNVSCMLVTCLINFAAIILLCTVEIKEMCQDLAGNFAQYNFITRLLKLKLLSICTRSIS